MSRRSQQYLRLPNLPALAFVLALLTAWEWLVTSNTLQMNYLPAPTAILETVGDLMSSGELPTALRETLIVTIVASVIAILTGGVVGILYAMIPALQTWTGASIDVLRTIPVVALMPVALLIWGSSSTSEIIVASFAGFWLMVVNTAGGVQQMNPRLHDVAHVFGMTFADRLRKIVAPAAAAPMLVGARLAVVACLIVAIVAEMLISYQGLGYALSRAQNALQPEQMWAYALTCGVAGYALNLILVRGARIALPGGRELREVGR